MNYWLLKSEPDTYSIDDLARDGRAEWEGVRNFQARRHLQAMEEGDQAFFYHSSVKPAGVAGMAEIVRAAYPDDTAWDESSAYRDPKSTPEKPIWCRVDVKFINKFPRLVTLDEIKANPRLNGMVLLKAPRLSVQPVTAEHFNIIRQMREAG